MKQIILFALMCCMPLCAMSQPAEGRGDRRFDPQKFQQMVEQSLTKAASLTPEEAKAFFPLYNEMKTKQREMGGQIHQLKKSASGDDKAYTSTILKIKQLQVEMAELEQNYYKRILKVVPPEKVFRVMKAEDDFHRRMVQGQRGRRPDGKQHGQRPPQDK